MYSINSFAVNRLNNAEFVGFFLNLNHAIDNAGAENLGLDAGAMTIFSDLLTKLGEQVRASTASQYTQIMEQTNSKRIQIFKRIIYKLKAVEVAEEHSELLSCKAQVETYLLGTYSLAVTKLPMQELTTVLNGFCYDLRDKLSEDDLDILSVTSDVSRLEQANHAFIKAYNDRVDERASVGNALTQTLRQQMHDLYLTICYTTQYLANSQAEANATKAKACQPFIEVVNEYLADAKRRYNQRLNALHAGKDGSGEDDGSSGNEQGGTEQPGGDNGQQGGDGGQQTGGNGSGTGGSTGGTNTGGSTGGNTGGGSSSGGKVPVEL